jgi:hypothetical protein
MAIIDTEDISIEDFAKEIMEAENTDANYMVMAEYLIDWLEREYANRY